jgi:hypothetical protein
MNAPNVDAHWALNIDRDGTVDPKGAAALVAHLSASSITDLMMFAHGWNTDEAGATALYNRWHELLSAQVKSVDSMGFVGIRWPSQLWRDQPIPLYPQPARPPGGSSAAAGGAPTMKMAGSASLTADELGDLKGVFPGCKTELDAIAALLAADPTQVSADDLFDALKAFGAKDPEGRNDGEAPATVEPPMLDTTTPDELFTSFAHHLIQGGVAFPAAGGGAGGRARAVAEKRQRSAKEVLRWTSYWKMKERAGVVGEYGVGKLITQLSHTLPNLRIHLIGHSFGARVVAFALAGVPATQSASRPIKSVTLLQGAFSRFAFAAEPPFKVLGQVKSGALVDKLSRIDGPLTVCFSSHDGALSSFYPMAAMTKLDWAAGGTGDWMKRWRAMGHLGAYVPGTSPVDLGAVGHLYSFTAGAILNVDASNVVFRGDPPFGGHSDICHPELAWLVTAAAKLSR